MKKMRRLKISDHISIDDAWERLERAGISVAYSEEDACHRTVHIFNSSEIALKTFDWIEKIEDYHLPEIDWESQWQIHGMDFKEGLVHVDLSQFGSYQSILRLKPGPGFGDLSHPTTRLILRLMPKYLLQQEVIDIGCGSGILTLAAAAMGAPMAYGIDIDESALKHSGENAKINKMEKKCRWMLPSRLKKKDFSEELILMNMIFSQQKVAWHSLPMLHHTSVKILTSGIMLEERKSYLHETGKWGWQMIEELEEAGWIGFCFQQS